jgi:hypothetical protein
MAGQNHRNGLLSPPSAFQIFGMWPSVFLMSFVFQSWFLNCVWCLDLGVLISGVCLYLSPTEFICGYVGLNNYGPIPVFPQA